MKKHHIRFNQAQLRTEVVPVHGPRLCALDPWSWPGVRRCALAAILVFDQYFESPKVRSQQRQIAFLEAQLGAMEGQVAEMSDALEELVERDEVIYRNIFGAEPYPPHLRNPGIGGADRYRDLRGLEQSDQVIALRRTSPGLSAAWWRKGRVCRNSWDSPRTRRPC